MKALIVDDEPLARDELHYLLEQNDLINEINEADGINEAREKVEKNRPDLIFLDIQLDDGSGMAFAKRLKKMDDGPYIVFATAYDQYALDAFEADAIDYVLKPFEQERIDDAVNRVAKLLNNNQYNNEVTPQQKNPRISLTNDERTIVIPKRDILYVQAQNGKAVVHTEKQEIISKQTLNSMISLLDPKRFIRVHRGFVVNLNKVHELQPSFNHTYELTLDDGSKIPVSRSFVSATKQALGVK
ncbi:response regulator transcription factor [Limosilactobacillus sp. Sa3CUN2]|uniref:Response regulator transcription factor n=1 Tax=Limosilactobacillus avistercoris TaxID=2762243 RepID=A0ABR8PAT3_9LACO|nr:LytTR family DNA-binding domain-containing protein [Limosilactobacillus avistercoris]MBD7894385.1 response regulator transcription factor [Limosilactobacillus avistercoris]